MASETVNIPIPTEPAKELRTRAAKAGMTVPPYPAFVTRIVVQCHDHDFVNAVRFVMTKFPDSTRKRAE